MPKIGYDRLGFSIPGLREMMQNRPELELEKTFHHPDGKPLTRDEAIAYLQQLEANGITTSSQLHDEKKSRTTSPATMDKKKRKPSRS